LGPETSAAPTGNVASLPQEVIAKLAEEIGKAVKSSNVAGHGETLLGMLMQVLKTHLSMRRKLLKKFLTERAVGRFRSLLAAPHRQRKDVAA
jgi:hypothetical protein